MEDESEENFNNKILKLTWPYLLVIFLLNILEGINIYETIFMANYLNLTFTQIGIILALAAFFRTIFEIPSGIIGDKIGNKKNILIGTLFISIGYFLISLSHIYSLIAGIILISIGDALWISSLSASAVEFIRSKGISDLTNFFSIKTITISLGYLLGLCINAILIKIFDLKFLFLWGGIIGILTFLLSIFLIKDTNNKKHSHKKIKSEQNIIELYKSLIKIGKFVISNNFLKTLLIITFLSSISLEGFYNFIYIFINKVGHLAEDKINIIALIETIIGIVVPIIILKLNGNILKRKKLLFVISLFSIGILFTILGNIVNLKLQFIILALEYLVINIFYILKESLIHENIYTYRNTIISLFNTVENIGEILGAVIIGFIIDKYGFTIGFTAIGGMFILSFILALFKIKISTQKAKNNFFTKSLLKLQKA